MINQAVIIAAGMGSRLNGNGKDLPKPLVSVAGVPLLKRTILTAERAGIREFVVVTGYRAEEIEAAIENDPQITVPVTFVRNADYERPNGLSVMAARPHVRGPFVLMMSDHLFSPEAIAKLRDTPLGAGECALCVDHDIDDVFDMDDATKVRVSSGRIEAIGKALEDFNAIDTGIFLCSEALFDALERAIADGEESLSGGIRRLAAEGRMLAAPIDGVFWEDVDTPASLRHAERTMFRSLAKPTDGFVARNFNRKVSAFVTRFLVKTPITPNQISIGTMLMSLFAAWLVTDPTYLNLALGGVLFQLASIVDGCDGEVARLKFTGSPTGEWVDTIADVFSYMVFFVCVVLGVSEMTGQTFYTVFGLSTITFTFAAVGFVMLYLRKSGSGSIVSFNMAFGHEVPHEKRNWFHALSVTMKPFSRRDFFAALFCVLALADALLVAYWIFTMGAMLIGAAISVYGGHMMRSRGFWPTTAEVSAGDRKLVSEKAD